MTVEWRLHVGSVPCLLSVAATPICVELSRKDAGWLAYVALSGKVPAARVAGLLWPTPDSRRSLNSLRQRLHRLRRTTGARLLEVGETAALATDLSLVEPRECVAIETADDASGDTLLGLLGAFDYGDLEDFAAWLDVERSAWSARRHEALAEAASQAESKHEIARALVVAKRLLMDEPLSEHAHRRVMRLHYLRGDVALAIAAFDACERVLKDELGLKPSAETLDMLRLVEQGAGSGSDRTRSLIVPVGLLRPPRTIGRAAEQARLAQATHGGSIVLLVGEAGIGKTRLLQDGVAAHPRAVYAQARPGDAAVPYGALARLLRAVVAAFPAALAHAPRHELARVAPELGDAMPVTGQAMRLQSAIELLLASVVQSGPALGDVREPAARFVLDDLHFADRASIEMLRALVDAESLVDASWVFAHRPVGVADEDGALLQSLADSPRADWIALPALGEPALAELIDSLAMGGLSGVALAGALWRHTGGNPLYALETLRAAHGVAADASGALRLPKPHNIAHMIDRRLQRLSERAMALGRVAALAGPDFSAALAEHALATPALALAGAWAELEAADVLRGNAFAHDLVHDAMLRATPKAIAVHAHRLIAQYLEGHDSEPARVAHHWENATEWAAAGAAYLAAARRAQAADRPRERAELLLLAARVYAECADVDSAARARIEAVLPLLQSDGTDRALALGIELAHELEATPHAARARSCHALACLWAGRPAEAEQAARAAMASAAADDDLVHIEAAQTAAQACGLQGRADEGLALMRGVESSIDRIDDLDQRMEFAGAFENLMIQADRPVESLHWTRKHLSYAEQSGNAAEQMTALMNFAGYHLRQGDLDAGIAHARLAAARAPAGKQARALAGWNDSGLGYMLCGVGRYAEGMAILEAELAHGDGVVSALRANQEQWLAQVLLTLGQVARAGQLLGADESLPPGLRRAKRLIARAALQRALGQADEALLLEAREAAQGPAFRYEQLTIDIELASRCGPDEADRWCEQLAAQAREREYFPLVILAEMACLRARQQAHRADDAATLATSLEVLARRYRHPIVYFPAVLQACAAAHLDCGRRDEARRCLTEALHWVHAVALPQVPQAYRESFMQRNAVNRRLQSDFGLAADMGR